MRLENGQWRRVSWDEALDAISAKLLDIRKQSGPDAVYWIGSSKYSNEQAYLLRKFVSLWGTNNCDHQARICHSTTVAGVANTFGYGAMTNSFNDMLNTKAMVFFGSNAAESHPVTMQMILHAKEQGARMIVVDPRFTRTAAKAHHYVRIRPGADIPFIWGVLRTIFENGWEDKKYIAERVYGMDDIREEAAKWTPDRVEDVTGVTPDQSCNSRSATSACRAAAPTSSGATTTCKAPPTSVPTRTRSPPITAFPKAPGGTGPAFGACRMTGSRRASPRRR
jgi:formate dehydrogenase major subunit